MRHDGASDGPAPPVDRSAFDKSVATVRASVADTPEALRGGVHGPGSTTWEIARESVLFLGGGRAALLQLAHPYVAHAIDQHSQTQTDPIGRFQRTFLHVHAMVFGELQMAMQSSERVRRIHEAIEGPIREDIGRFREGHRYFANDPSALLWVHATLIHTAVQVYEAVVAPLSMARRDEYWHESKRFARLFGVPEDIMPRDWSDFEAYFHRALASADIAVGQPARAIAKFLLTPPRASAAPVMAWYRRMTTGLLPPALRAPFGLPFTRADAVLFRGSLLTLRATYPRLPRRLRDIPAYTEAQRRLRGEPAPARVGRALERWMLHWVTPPP